MENKKTTQEEKALPTFVNMSPRFYAACNIIQGIIAGGYASSLEPNEIAELSFKYADALIRKEETELIQDKAKAKAKANYEISKAYFGLK